ncbi:MarR family winged helix-turn-helix transcriptional regulator [Fodinicola acaciae]|uniref:MarR family winged helix-turn-helix transcriptional regulator n=1 Tax=Fodinicola acaciae TaxID=2681555 RepID=UPI001C9E788C|nr:MarR family transcriptional regulator [Fodinicola acaciae]
MNVVDGTESVPEKDSVDRNLEYWQEEIPDLDARAEEIAGRIHLLAKHMSRPRQRSLEAQGLQQWEFQTLKLLRRRGRPYEATPGELAAAIGLSPAAMTKRLDGMERSGYVRRSHDSQDRRRVTVRLTQAGMKAWSQAIDEQGRVEQKLVHALNADQQDQLAALLRQMLLLAESEGGAL